MHIRRIAPQLADLFARHGHEARVEATVTGRTRTSYRVPIVLRTASGTVLVDGDLESPALDDAGVLRLYLMAVDCGAKAIFLHSGTAPSAACEACGDKVTLWSQRDAAQALGDTLWNAALGLPLPALPGLPAGAPVGCVPLTEALAPLAPDPVATPVPLYEPVAAAPSEDTGEEDVSQDTAIPAPQSATSTAPVSPLPSPLPPGAAAEPFIDLDDGISEAPAVDLETGVDVVVTTLPTDEADELSTAEPLMALAPTTVAEALPPAFQEAEGSGPPASEPAEPPIFELPPAFRTDAAAGPALPVPEGSRGLLPALVTLDEARRSVSDRLFGIDEWELILQPVHLFDYAVEVLRPGSLSADTQRGRLQVNGTDRRVTRLDEAGADGALHARVFASDDLTVMDKVLRVNPERAEQVANDWATATYGKIVHVNMAGADDSFDLTERQTIGPTSSQVKLGYLGLWHRPFWRLWGANGHVDLDAVDGHVLEQELKDASADFLLVD